MTDEITERVIQLEKRIIGVEEIIVGSRGDPGLIHSLKQVVKDMYDQSTGFGALHRIDKLEREKLIYEGRVQGAAWMGRVFWVVLGAALTYGIVKIVPLVK